MINPHQSVPGAQGTLKDRHLERGQHERHVTSSGDQAKGDGTVWSEHPQPLQTDAVQLLIQTPGVQAGHKEFGRVHCQVVLQQTQ